MGKILSRMRWKKIWELIDEQINEVLFYIELASAWVLRGYPDYIWDWCEYHLWNFRAMMSYDSDDGELEFCIDKEGIHKVGDTWSSRNRCNKKVCIAHDMIKELRCPTIPDEHDCKVHKRSLTEEYPRCCDELVCSLSDNLRPILRPAKPVYWVYENYIHAFSSSSEEELDPHPSTISAKLSGLQPPD